MAGNGDDPIQPEDRAAVPERVEHASAAAESAEHAPIAAESAENASVSPGSTAQKPAKKPLARSFHCTNCGASVTIRYPGAAMSVVCQGCHSVIDALDPNCRILTKFYKATRAHEPLLALGSRGQLKGRNWEVIGFMVRSDVSSGYSWEEYLLFNPYYGFRWLTQDKGHWNFVTTIKRKPERPASSVAVLDGRKYRLYNRGSAQVDYVIGEFYWRVVVNSRVDMTDYIDPPNMLSSEKDILEVVWSLSEYIEPQEIAKAFSPEAKFPWPSGVSPTMPAKAKESFEKVKLLFILFCGIITCAQIYYSGTAINKICTQYYGSFVPGVKQSDITTPVFELPKDKANVAIQISAPVSNSWFWVSGEMVNNDTGVSYPFEQSVEYYFGRDSDGPWTEGSNSVRQMLAAVPGGKYYINLDTENGSFKTTDKQAFEIIVARDVPTFDNYFWTIFFLSILPILSWWIMRKTEAERWSNSDFSPYASST